MQSDSRSRPAALQSHIKWIPIISNRSTLHNPAQTRAKLVTPARIVFGISMSKIDKPAGPDHPSEPILSRINRNGIFACALIFTGGLFAAVLRTRGSMSKIFADFDVIRTPVTKIALSEYFVWILGALFGLTIIKELLLKKSKLKAVCSILAVLVAVSLGLLYVVGAFLPLIGTSKM
jgi:hypothetical protein